MFKGGRLLKHDKARLTLIAGSGGAGVVAWRREKFIPKGGPCGGDGGGGGSIYLQSDSQISSLDSFRNRRIIRAKNGQPGRSNYCTGKNGEDLTLKVPCGTLVKDITTGEILYDFVEGDRYERICKGGLGGKGNDRFKSSTNQAPNLSTQGTPGEVREVELELKLIADVGLLGMPNAGKSSLISLITPLKPKIAAYPFTTLFPNISYFCREDHSRILVADIPGIIEGAHLDRGLGYEFLKHIERCYLLVYIIDISGMEGRNPLDDFRVLRNELKKYNPFLLQKPFLVVLNKIDIEGAEENINRFQHKYKSLKVILTSALESRGTNELLGAIQTQLNDTQVK